MIERRNHEGYADPTAYAALTKVFRQNRFTYICSPYRDNPRVNVMRARSTASLLWAEGRYHSRRICTFLSFCRRQMSGRKRWI